jgi:hypothetical protein
LCRGSRLATCYSKAQKRLRNLQYVRRPGPDSGCLAIGWMDGWMDGIVIIALLFNVRFENSYFPSNSVEHNPMGYTNNRNFMKCKI